MTYAELLAAIPSWITRRDATDALCRLWVSLAEARINRVLRVRQMLKRSRAVITDEFSTLPADFLAPRFMRVEGSDPEDFLAFMTPEQMAVFNAGKPSGDLAAYSLIGGQFWFLPVPVTATTVELIFYANVPALSDTATSNWLLAAHPDLYLAGAILEAWHFYEDEEQIQRWEAKFTTAVVDLHDADLRDINAATLTPLPNGAVA